MKNCKIIFSLLSIAVFIGLFGLFPFSFVYGQVNINSSMESFSLNISPDIPSPGDQAEASVTSNSFDINSSFITWLRNGFVVSEGRGKKTYQFKVGPVGKEEIIRAIIITPSGNQLERTLSFIVGDVDLLWRAKTSVPVFYPGKALPALRSMVKITAEPHFIFQGQRIAASSLIYDWYLGENLYKDDSGFGKQTFEFSMPVTAVNGQRVRVQISSLKGSIRAQKTIFIPVVNPFAVVYEENPLEGPKFNRALREINSFSSGQIDFLAAPYYFSDLGSLHYAWTVNGKPAEKKEPFNILNLKILEGFIGSILVNLTVNNPINVLQRAELSFKINVE